MIASASCVEEERNVTQDREPCKGHIQGAAREGENEDERESDRGPRHGSGHEQDRGRGREPDCGPDREVSAEDLSWVRDRVLIRISLQPGLERHCEPDPHPDREHVPDSWHDPNVSTTAGLAASPNISKVASRRRSLLVFRLGTRTPEPQAMHPRSG